MTSDILRVKRLHPEAVLPVRAHDDDAGYDLFSIEPLTIQPGESVPVRTGIAIALHRGTMGEIRPRSGLMFRSQVFGAVGTIDAGYRGEIKALLTNHGKMPVTIPPQSAIAQLVIVPILTPRIVEVQELDETLRGASGFGSTDTAPPTTTSY